MARVLLLAFILSMIIELAEPSTKTECGVAQTAFGMCVPYLMGWDRSLSPQCCMAVRSVKELSRTPKAQKSVCECLEKLVVKIGKIDHRRAASLSVRCRIRGSIIPTGLRDQQIATELAGIESRRSSLGSVVCAGIATEFA